MKRGAALALGMALLAGGAAAVAAPAPGRGGADEVEPPRTGLSAKVVRSKLPLETNELRWELVLTNEGKTPLRVCTLCGGSAGGWKGHHEQTFAPDWWKSDRPTPAQSAEMIVTLEPGQSVSLPGSLGGFRGEKYTLKAAYEVGKEFAARHKVWQGRVVAKPVVIRTVKPKKE